MDKIQSLQIEMLKNLDFGSIHGGKIASDLLAHQDCWQAVMIEFRWYINRHKPVKEFWVVWKIYLLTIPGKEDELFRLANSWCPTDIKFVGEPFTLSMMDEIFLTDEDEVEFDPKLYLAVSWD